MGILDNVVIRYSLHSPAFICIIIIYNSVHMQNQHTTKNYKYCIRLLTHPSILKCAYLYTRLFPFFFKDENKSTASYNKRHCGLSNKYICNCIHKRARARVCVFADLFARFGCTRVLEINRV